MFALVLCCVFFPFCLLKTAVCRAAIFSFITSILKSLVHKPRDTRKAIFYTDKKKVFGLRLYEIPSELICFQKLERFLQS